jgi:LysM repeat protein
VEKVAQQAGRAAPAVAIAGALVAAPHASHALGDSAKPVAVTAQGHTATASSTTTRATAATLDSVTTRTVAVTAASQARHAATAQSTTYRVQPGDTLSKLANRFFHNNDWQYLYQVNDKTISDPNLIYMGESLVIPASAPAHYTLAGYAPRHAKPAAAAAPAARTVAPAAPDNDDSQASAPAATHAGSTATRGTSGGGAAVVLQSVTQGQYSCAGLEQLWVQAGGSPGAAVMAADIAMAESGGNPNAISPTNDYGLWQINGSHGSLATLNPQANARSAVIVSSNGTNWNPWTTYRTGAYSGRC